MSMLAAADTVSDVVPGFEGQPVWIVIIKVLGGFVFLVVMTLFSIVFERKVVGRMQNRIGPNRVGPWGTLQSLADGMKLHMPGLPVPLPHGKPVYFLAPLLFPIPAFLAVAFPQFDASMATSTPRSTLQLTDLPAGVL